MKLIVGLGNPGTQYIRTRHNLGFMIIDALADKCAIDLGTKKHQSLVGQGIFDGTRIMVVKPQTYMNKSGEAVMEILHYYHDKIEDLIIIHDDLDLDFGRIRFKPDGGTGGHKGLQSITRMLNSEEYARLKVGIGRPPERMPVEAFVLSTLGSREKENLPQLIDLCLEGLNCWCSHGIVKTMNDFNFKFIII